MNKPERNVGGDTVTVRGTWIEETHCTCDLWPSRSSCSTAIEGNTDAWRGSGRGRGRGWPGRRRGAGR